MSPAPPVRISQSRIGRLHTHLLGVPRDAVLTPCVTGVDQHTSRMREVGFPGRPQVGQEVLPAVVGPRSRFNADGAEQVRRDRPPERVARLAWTGWVERDGDRERAVRDVRPRSFRRLPRARQAAPEVRLSVCQGRSGDLVLATEPLTRGRDDARMFHAVNLLLELFGECVMIDERERRLARGTQSRLDWEVVTPAEAIAALSDGVPAPMRPVAERRLAAVAALEPRFAAVGRGGFAGCGVFGPSPEGPLVVECLHAGTHVTARSWPDLVALSKAELLGGAEVEIAHAPGWEDRLREAATAD